MTEVTVLAARVEADTAMEVAVTAALAVANGTAVDRSRGGHEQEAACKGLTIVDSAMAYEHAIKAAEHAARAEFFHRMSFDVDPVLRGALSIAVEHHMYKAEDHRAGAEIAAGLA